MSKFGNIVGCADVIMRTSIVEIWLLKKAKLHPLKCLSVSSDTQKGPQL